MPTTQIWQGKQIARPWIKTLTVTTADAANTITLTCGGTQTVVVTPSTTNTTTTASELAAAASAAGGCFSELSFSPSAAAITITGPADGAPVTFSKTDAGSNATVLASVQTPTSPSDLNDAANWSTSVPTAGDTAVFDSTSSVDAKYNCDAIATITLATGQGIVKRKGYTGRWGLPVTNPNGFQEYRVTELQWKSDGMLFEPGDRDQAGQYRAKCMFTASAVTVTVQGSGSNAQVGSEALEISGLPAASIVYCTGASVALAPYQGQACIVVTLNAVNSTVRVGQGATLSGTVQFENCQALVKVSWTTSLKVDKGSDVEVAGAAAGPLISILRGSTLTWHSTGNPGNSPTVGTQSTLDLETAPGTSISIGGTIAAYAGCRILNSAGRGGVLVVQPVDCTLADITWNTLVGKTYTEA